MNPRSLILDMTRRFRSAGIPDPENDSAFLLAFLCGRNTLSLRLDTETELDQETVSRYLALCERRIRREPLQYIMGECLFCGNSFRDLPGTAILAPLDAARIYAYRAFSEDMSILLWLSIGATQSLWGASMTSL